MPFMVKPPKICPGSVSSGNYHPQRDPVCVTMLHHTARAWEMRTNE